MTNTNNYASLEASKRLADAGIVLETELWWVYHDPCSRDDVAASCYGKWELADCTGGSSNYIPAPSMAEVWRELRKHLHNFQMHGKVWSALREKLFIDALIDLLIWVKGEKK